MQNKSNILKEAMQLFLSIVGVIVISLTLNTYVFARTVVDGTSMLPTLQNSNSLITENISRLTGNLKRGEIITFDSGNANHDIYVKRVIGIAGDEVEIVNGKVYLNGKELNESYLENTTVTTGGTFLHENEKLKIAEGSVFVLGDNRAVSNDSRYLGPISISSIKGHVVLRIYPFNEITIIK